MPNKQWSKRTVFLFAAIGSAVGLGNVWKFPYMVGENGGALFILLYLLSVVIVVVPIMTAELMIGRMGGASPVATVRALATRNGLSPHWRWLGWLGMLIAFAILTYFSVIAGWCVAYIGYSLSGAFVAAGSEQTSAVFDALLANPLLLTVLEFFVIGVTVAIVARGLHRGLERALGWMMPLLLILLVIVIINAGIIGDFGAGLDYLFSVDFAQMRPNTVLMAVGQAFLSNSVAMGIMLTYGAYTTRDTSLGGSALIISGADTAIALLAGLAVFPLIFAFGFAPGEGPGLIFVTLPVALGAMPYGAIVGAVFFLLLLIAALTSTISLLEPLVSYLEEHKGASRPKMAVIAGAGAFAIGMLSVLSFNLLQNFHPLDFLPAFATSTLFDIIDFAITNILLPVSALLLAVFVGWRLPKRESGRELAISRKIIFEIWYGLIRYVVPAALATVFVFNLWQG